MLLPCAAVLGGCDAGERDNILLDKPPLHVVEVLACGGRDAHGFLVREALEDSGATEGVLPTSSLTVQFDRYLDPVTVSRQSFCLSGTTTAVADPTQCVEGRVFGQPLYDPIRRTVTLYSLANDPLPLGTKHSLTMLAPPPEDGDIVYGFRAFDGAPLEATFAIQFTTAGTDDPDAPSERPPTAESFCGDGGCADGSAITPEAAACRAACDPDDMQYDSCLTGCCPKSVRTILAGCSYATCHATGTTADGGPLGAAMGLDMSTAELVRLTAIGRVAHQTQQGEHAALADRNPARFGRAMPIIDPQNAGNSYLLYKLMAHTDFVGKGETGADPTEVARMRNALVVGMQMPATPTTSLQVSASRSDYDTLSAWISQGASAPNCN
ncbi:MAG: hypothetical protein WKG00_29655 [Polyangiaceae bacterium]